MILFIIERSRVLRRTDHFSPGFNATQTVTHRHRPCWWRQDEGRVPVAATAQVTLCRYLRRRPVRCYYVSWSRRFWLPHRRAATTTKGVLIVGLLHLDMDRQGIMSDMEMGTLATDIAADEAGPGTMIDLQCQGIRPRLRHKIPAAVSEAG